MKISKLITLGAALALTCGAANASVITLDFDTAATGANILSSPLVTSAGTVSVVNGASIEPGFSTNTTQWLRHDNRPTPGYAQIIFGFNVSSVTFDFTGYGFGSFSAQVLDASNIIIASFSVADASSPDWSLSHTLSGVGIHELRFRDTVSNQSGIDNLQITAVPEPASLALLGLGLVGLVASRRRKTA